MIPGTPRTGGKLFSRPNSILALCFLKTARSFRAFDYDAEPEAPHCIAQGRIWIVHDRSTMTLLEAVDSLEFMEVTAVSWINIIPSRAHDVAFFTIAFVLPFIDAKLPDEYRTGPPRFWPD